MKHPELLSLPVSLGLTTPNLQQRIPGPMQL